MTTEAVVQPLDASLQGVAPGRASVMRGFLLLAMLMIVIGELTFAGGSPFVGVAIEALAVVLLASGRWHLSADAQTPPPAAFTHACAVVALLPIMRLLSVTVPFKRASEIAWYALIGLPLLVVLVRLVGEQEHLRGLLRIRRHYLSQGLIALIGIPLGMLGYLIARPDPLGSGSVFANPLIAFVVLTVFSGLMEEMLFRGVLTDALELFFGGVGALLLSAMLFAIFNATAGGVSFALFALVYGLVFGLIVRRTGSLVGVSVAHGLLTTGLIVIWPAVWG